MLKATLFVALYGLSAGEVELDYGDSKPAKEPMCCTANIAISGAYSECKTRMKKDACVGSDDLCYWTECDKVGYCVDPRDDLYFDEEMALERRSMLSAEYSIVTPEPTSGWGMGAPPKKTPRPTVDRSRTPRPTIDHSRTDRPTVDRTRTERPTVDRTRTERPTKPVKTPKPTKEPKPVKTPRPTPDRQAKTRRPTIDKTPRPTKEGNVRTEKPTKNRDKATYIRTSPTKDKTPRPTPWNGAIDAEIEIIADYGSTCPVKGISNVDCYFDGDCEYGEETCCGETTAALVCRCQSNGKTSCIHKDRCRMPECETPQPTMDDGAGWGQPKQTVDPTTSQRTPRPTVDRSRTPRPTIDHSRTERPTVDRTRTERPTVDRTRTERPTKPVKTPKPTMIKTPKPTKEPKPVKTPRPTPDRQAKTRRPTMDKTPRPTKEGNVRTEKPTKNRDKATYIRTSPTKDKTPRPTPWNNKLNAHIVDADAVELDYATPRPTAWQTTTTEEPTPCDGIEPTKPPKTPRPTMDKTPRPTPGTAPRTPKPTMDKTPRPTMVKTPKPTTIKTSKPTMIRTPKPIMVKTPKPTAWKSPRPTKGEKTAKPTMVRTPKPTMDKTPRPTKVDKTPRPTKAKKTPEPTLDGSGWGAPKTTDACPVAVCSDPCVTCMADEECVTKRTYFDDERRCPACDELVDCKPEDGWGTGKPLTGCALFVRKGQCSEECVWKKGYPPMAFEEDSAYQLQSEFMVNGYSASALVNSDEFMLYFGIGLLIAAVFVFVFGSYSMMKNGKTLSSETSQLIAA